MAHLTDLFDLELLDRMLAEKYVRETICADTGLRLLSYTDATQHKRNWNPVTSACRGLIANQDGRIVARPFAKFFNYGEPDAPAATGPVTVTDKLDGSLGILYSTGQVNRIATRGSFNSDQALHATNVLHTRYPHFDPVDGWTYMYEIIYPDNRIVVDYQDLDDIILIGAVDIESGVSVPLSQAASTWPGPVVDVYDHPNLEAAVNSPPRPNREGFVVHFTDMDVRLKVKYAEYQRLHKIRTRMSTLTVFEHLKAGLPVEDLVADAPDELRAVITDYAEHLTAQHVAVAAAAHALYTNIAARHDPAVDRKAFALAVLDLDFESKHLLFGLADRGVVDSERIWDTIRPAHKLLFGPAEDD